MKTLADTMKRLIGPDGVYSSNATASVASKGVSRSTFDRLRNGDKVGASAVAIDKLDGVAKAFGVQVWQLFVPGMDPRAGLPKLASETEIEKILTDSEKMLLDTYRKVGKKEQEYLLADALKYLNAGK